STAPVALPTRLSLVPPQELKATNRKIIAPIPNGDDLLIETFGDFSKFVQPSFSKLIIVIVNLDWK
ncbi:hypothetical protein M1N56_08730, partial [Dehalococcoidia bacterium]|nr:hypothetical protein [Dehalococcoidia bacterium]